VDGKADQFGEEIGEQQFARVPEQAFAEMGETISER
jgi:hypothetical protein